MMNTADIAWLAGIIEGEAAFDAHSPAAYPRITLAMCDLDVVIRFAEITGATCVRTKKNVHGVKQQYHARISGPRAICWLMTIYVLMGERRKQQIAALIDAWKKNIQKTRDPKKRQPGHEHRLPEILALFDKGKTQEQIGAALGINPASVSRVMLAAGIRARSSNRQPHQQKSLVWQRLPAHGA